METEIWPNIIHCCKKKGIVTSLVNARLSEKSKSKYLRFSSLIKPAINSLDLVLAQYKSDADRFNEIVTDKKIELCGNLKFDQEEVLSFKYYYLYLFTFYKKESCLRKHKK